MQYRKEIDGLRAIAVIPVVLFHAGVAGFGGGYIGVDIFFVISGYLITSIILEEKKNDRFSIMKFYERRARRILPALSTLLIFTSIAAYVLMPASLLKMYSQSLASVATFSSNLFFYLKSDYFAPEADENPLLHTWSLAVEEQFYFILPLLIIVFWPMGIKRLAGVVVLIAVASLLLSQALSGHFTDGNFYLISSRAWELLSGSLIAFLSLRQISFSRWQSELAGLVGFLMILYSIVYFDAQTPFPSFHTLIPILGTCLIIIFTGPESCLGRLLSSRALVLTGLISYSLYLWHQPIFAFLRMKSIGEPSFPVFTGAILAAFVLAYLSWKYIEAPFRNKAIFDRASIFRYSVASIILFFSVGLAGHVGEGFDQRFEPSGYLASIEHSPKRDECHTKGADYIRPGEACRYFGKNVSWASFGDSHTVEPAYALAKKLEAYDIGLMHFSFSGCSPSYLYEVTQPGCTKWIRETLNYLVSNDAIENVLLGFRYSSFLFGDQLDSYPRPPDISPGSAFSAPLHKSAPEELREVYWRSFEAIVTRLLEAGKHVYVLYPIPELPVDINKAVMPIWVFGSETTLDLAHASGAEYYFERNRFILDKLDSLPYGENLHAIKPFELICEGGVCPVVKGNKSLYFDDNHLSLSGAELVIEGLHLEERYLTDAPVSRAASGGDLAVH